MYWTFPLMQFQYKNGNPEWSLLLFIIPIKLGFSSCSDEYINPPRMQYILWCVGSVAILTHHWGRSIFPTSFTEHTPSIPMISPFISRKARCNCVPPSGCNRCFTEFISRLYWLLHFLNLELLCLFVLKQQNEQTPQRNLFTMPSVRPREEETPG